MGSLCGVEHRGGCQGEDVGGGREHYGTQRNHGSLPANGNIDDASVIHNSKEVRGGAIG